MQIQTAVFWGCPEGFERTDVDAIIGKLIENHKLHQETNVSCHWRLGNFIIQYYMKLDNTTEC